MLTMTEKDLEKMVDDLVLPEKDVIGWRAASGESFPTTDTNEIVVFDLFFYRGFALPTSVFFRSLLHWYRIKLIHLNPNSIIHIATFIHLCEVFLGVRPHFNLFRYFFILKPSLKDGKISVVGGAGLQLRQGKGKEYLGLRFKTSLKGWHQRWFYTSNLSPDLRAYARHRPVVEASWT